MRTHSTPMKQLGLWRLSIFFALFLTFSGGLLGYIFVIGDREIGTTKDQIDHAYRVIEQAKDIAGLTEGMLASQRGYILTGKDSFRIDFQDKHAAALEHLSALIQLTRSSDSQTSRAREAWRTMRSFGSLLEDRARRYNLHLADEEFIKVADQITAAKDAIISINTNLLNEEYSILARRVLELEQKKANYYSTIATGGTLAIILVFLFNAAALYFLSRRAEMEQLLKSSEDRFALAIEGTNDGIFDWDMKTGRVFYSRQFFLMLGDNKAATIGVIDDFRHLIHPDDAPKVWQYIDRYLHHELSEYSTTFRMRHASGRWIWVNSRAKATFSKEGEPLRMVGANADITYMKQYQERLKDEKLKAESANRAKGEFLAHMSHEIRTPLTAISGISEIFQRNDKNLDEKQKKLVKTLHSSTMSLKDLVNDILDFSKIESGELELKAEDIDLTELLQQVSSIISVQAAEKGIAFAFDNHMPVMGFKGDSLRLRQVIINLAGNAVKFTEKGSVVIAASREFKSGMPYLKVTVTDTGPGIAPENHEVIFERFKQVDGSETRRHGGSGLGLTISRNLVTLMQGTLGVKSKLGEGAVFTMMVPWLDAQQLQNMDLDISDDSKLNDKMAAEVAGENRILVVEDYEGNIVVVTYILEEMGCAFDIARNGIEALNLWTQRHYDVVLMDVQMPEMDGFTATKKLRALEESNKLPRTPIIGMTAHALVGDKNKCIEAGMDAYLPKPIVEGDLKSEIMKYISAKNTNPLSS